MKTYYAGPQISELALELIKHQILDLENDVGRKDKQLTRLQHRVEELEKKLKLPPTYPSR